MKYENCKDPRKDARPSLSSAVQHLAQAALDVEDAAQHATEHERAQLRPIWGHLRALRKQVLDIRVNNPSGEDMVLRKLLSTPAPQ